MHRVKPRIHLISVPRINKDELQSYLSTIGAGDWVSDASSDLEELIEVMGRGCYKSFGTELNPNITRVRESSDEYLSNIIKSGHGSVLEHAFVSFMFTDVSRVFTHELVRHRVGTAISQESLRYLRLEDLGLWIPSIFHDNPQAEEIFERAFKQAEENYTRLLSEEVLGVDIDAMDFATKKELTSAARRIAPIGLATNIGWSCNVRNLRHVIEMRTDRHAEEEIRYVFAQVGALVYGKWPTLFNFNRTSVINGIVEFKGRD